MANQRERLLFCVDGLMRNPLNVFGDGYAEELHRILCDTRDTSPKNVTHDRSIDPDLWIAAESLLRARSAIVEASRELDAIRVKTGN